MRLVMWIMIGPFSNALAHALVHCHLPAPLARNRPKAATGRPLQPPHPVHPAPGDDRGGQGAAGTRRPG